jgi:hypothetical protein
LRGKHFVIGKRMSSTIGPQSRLVLVASIVALTGCAASTTVDVAATTPWVFQSAQHNGQQVAQCIIKNIDERYGTMDARLLPSSRPDLVEIRVREPHAGVASMIEIEPTEKGSAITIRIATDFINRDPIAQGFARGC